MPLQSRSATRNSIACYVLACCTTGRGAAFHMDNLPEVRLVFPSVERHVIDSALVFADAEPALRFYATNRIDLIQDRPADGSHRARLLPLVRERIEAIIR
ncbi:MAG: hypothetical protein QOF70_7028, partial [Acetobacteraceae bacterium]|nr:hypothetical protein [Acetobacteraceae bacterium]